MAGVATGTATSFTKFYPAIIASQTILRDVISKKYTTKRFAVPVDLDRIL